MKDLNYILQQAKKAYYSGWNDVELRKCVDMLPSISRQELVMLYSSRWLSHDKPLKDSIFHLLFDARIEERDTKIKASWRSQPPVCQRLSRMASYIARM